MRAFRFGYYLFGFGVLIVIFSLILDALGIGKPGIQAAQLTGISIGILVSFIGWGVALKEREEGAIPWNNIARKNLSRAADAPLLVWIIFGFLIPFILLFIVPNFLNGDHQVRYFNRYLPDIVPIGRDMTFSTENILKWLMSGTNLYDAKYHVYPPLYAVVFAPLVLLSYPARFYFITAVTFTCVIFLLLLMPTLLNMRRQYAVAVFFFLTVIISYGLQFEFERGQYNVIAFTFGIFAVYLFRYHESFRHLAYLLFSVAVHAKIYPAILILFFIKNWRDWKGNLMRFIGLGTFNAALLFALGPSMFLNFMNSITRYTSDTWSRPYNMSVRSFVYALHHQEVVPLPPSTAEWISRNSTLIELLVMVFFLLCLFTVVFKAYRNDELTINYDLLLICTIGALMIPSVSIDYKLPLLALPLTLALGGRSMQGSGLKRVLIVALIVILSASYSVTLFPFIYKPTPLANNFPVLFIMLASATLLNLLDGSALAKPPEAKKS